MMRTAAFLIALLVGSAWSQKLPDLYHDEVRGDGPYLTEPVWRPLLNGTDLNGWRGVDDAAHEWFTSRGVVWKRVWNPKQLVSRPEPGDRIVNGKQGKTANLVSDETFGSFELY